MTVETRFYDPELKLWYRKLNGGWQYRTGTIKGPSGVDWVASESAEWVEGRLVKCIRARVTIT